MTGEKNPESSLSQCDSVCGGNVLSLDEFQKRREIVGEIQALSRKHGIDEIILIATKDICVADWVQMKCKYGCKKFGRSWCCPPETPTPDRIRNLVSEYKRALLLCGSTRSIHFHRDNHQKRRKQVQVWKGTVALERHLFLAGYYKAFALVAENCALCKDCAYPDGCKFPMDRRPSVESFSIDVFQTLKNIGREFRISQDASDEHNYYSIILLK